MANKNFIYSVIFVFYARYLPKVLHQNSCDSAANMSIDGFDSTLLINGKGKLSINSARPQNKLSCRLHI